MKVVESIKLNPYDLNLTAINTYLFWNVLERMPKHIYFYN